MKPERASQTLLGITRSKAKMYEYGIPPEHHIHITRDPAQLFRLTVGLLGDVSARGNREDLREISNTDEDRRSLTFAARFFDAYRETQLRHDVDPYLLLLASSAFYLCDLPGSSSVLAKRIKLPIPDMEGDNIECLLHWLLIGDVSTRITYGFDGAFQAELEAVGESLTRYYATGTNAEALFQHAIALRSSVYSAGTPRQLLLADISCAVLRKRHAYSAWNLLPKYSGLSREDWVGAFKKQNFLRELWPSQRLLGEQGVFRGASAVVQMPTSAGKTRSTELIIRSAFLSGRTSSAVIVAPFRALCHEISNSLREAFAGEAVTIDELTDVLQLDFDFDLDELLDRKKVTVVTPEKFVYVLRHSPEVAEALGLIVYDEGHQFDSGLRGVTYELLLTALRRQLPKEAQTVLISAVISNAEAVGEWLLGKEPMVVTGRNLTPMHRTVAFASWLDTLGQLKFVAEDAPTQDEFFVPRVLSREELSRRPNEKKTRYFPERNDGQSIALYLGAKLVAQGSVAIFCGRKPTAAALCDKIVEAYDRGLSLPKPIEHANGKECENLANLYARNLGAEASASKSASLGIFSHHGNTPHGIRLAVEHAMKHEYAKFVICTSTLAQGVNLPIRYLIVTSVYQGEERIKVRDFHNLIGRAGRAGMHTEGTILFADPVVYDKKLDRKERWRWNQIQEILEPTNAEPVVSSLQTLFKPLQSDDGLVRLTMNLPQFANAYIQGRPYITALIAAIVRDHGNRGFTQKGLEEQISWRSRIFATIESYLLSHWDDAEGVEYVEQLARETLAYFLSEDAEKAQLVDLFQILAKHIETTIPQPERRKTFGRTLQGLTALIDLEAWIEQHLTELKAITEHEALLGYLWPLVAESIGNSTFKKLEKPKLLIGTAASWISGLPFDRLFEYLNSNDVKVTAGTQRRELKIDHVVDLCESAFAYDGALTIGAVADLIASRMDADCDNLIRMLNELHKRLKYGLPHTSALALYECGFADRVIAQELGRVIGPSPKTRSRVIRLLGEKESAIRSVLTRFPTYFSSVLTGLLA